MKAMKILSFLSEKRESIIQVTRNWIMAVSISKTYTQLGLKQNAQCTAISKASHQSMITRRSWIILCSLKQMSLHRLLYTPKVLPIKQCPSL
jgi:hypothetical protein